MVNKIGLVSLSLCALFSCQATSNSTVDKQAIDEKVKSMSKCEQVKALVREHKNGFEKIRKKKTSTKLANIWTARYHLVGEGCQVINWKGTNSSYMCSVISPGEEVALERYQNAKQQIQSCLGESWVLQERERHGKKGSVAIYSNKDTDTVVTTQAFETNGIFNDEWTNYIFVGDPKRIK